MPENELARAGFSTIARIVVERLVPVSPSATGKTLMSLRYFLCAATSCAPSENHSCRSKPFASVRSNGYSIVCPPSAKQSTPSFCNYHLLFGGCFVICNAYSIHLHSSIVAYVQRNRNDVFRAVIRDFFLLLCRFSKPVFQSSTHRLLLNPIVSFTIIIIISMNYY